jgi:predicted ArsR family transcriptional regulator
VNGIYRGATVPVLMAVCTMPHPTLRGIADELGIGYGTVRYHLDRLRALGCVDWTWGKDGTLRPLVRFEAVP